MKLQSQIQIQHHNKATKKSNHPSIFPLYNGKYYIIIISVFFIILFLQLSNQ